MKLYKILLFSFLAAFAFTSCEEVIELDLENDEPQIVIEAVVNANTQTATAFITYSNGFYEDVNLNTVDNATVQLTLANGNIVNLMGQGNGFYMADNVVVNNNDELSLVIIDGDGNQYQASTRVPHDVTIDSLSLLEAQSSPFAGDTEDEEYQVFTYWEDLAGIESFYQIKAIKNDTLLSTYTLSDDFQNDGLQLARPLFESFKSGEVVTMQLLSLDEKTFRYFSDLSAQQSQGLNSNTPFNPLNNFDNNALGYFGIIRMDTETVVIP